jgi:hypothetical protein
MKKLIISAVCFGCSQWALAALYPVTAITPVGTALTGVQNVTSLTANALTYTTALGQLAGPTSAQDSSALNASLSQSHPPLVPNISETSLIGLDMGAADLGLGSGTNPEYVAVWFAAPIVGDGNNLTPEFFVLDWAQTSDRFQVQLLTSGPGTGAAPTIATSVQVLPSNYSGLATTVIRTTLAGANANQPIGGVGISIDDLGLLPGTQILGLRVPTADGAGGRSGLDPCVFAAVVPEPAAALLAIAGLPMLARRRRMKG